MKQVTQMCAYALFATVTVASKEILAFLPNVELVSFLLIMYALHFKLSGALMISVLFCFIQMLLYGIGIWTPMYFVVWPLLILVTFILKKGLKTEQRCALFSGGFGLIFGFLFAIPYFFVSFNMGWIFFLKGIPFDLVHAVANYLIMILLFKQIKPVFERMAKKLYV